MRYWTVLICACVLAGLTACSRGESLGLPAGTANVWVGSDTTSAFMIQLTRQDRTLAGTLDQTSLAASGATAVDPLHAAFTGTVDGTAITLSFPGGFGFITNLSGTLTRSKMTLQVPQKDGSVAQAVLAPGTTEQYNLRAADVRASAAVNTSAVAVASAEAASADALRRAQQRIDDAAAAVIRDAAAVRGELAAPPGFAPFEAHMKEAKAQLASARTNAGSADAQSDELLACGFAYDAVTDSYDVQTESYSIDSAFWEIDAKVSSVGGAVSRVKDDLAKLTDAAAALPGYSPAAGVDVGAIEALTKQATTQSGSWSAKARKYQRDVAELVQQAKAVAEGAQQRHC